MVARSFRCAFSPNLQAVIFASGVSNSGCSDLSQFSREKSLLAEALATIPSGYKLIYFSTCSIYDSDMRLSPYVLHKLAMEELVLSIPGGLIIRLPQLAGRNAPRSTLLRYLVESIRAKKLVHVWRGARRSIIDIEDVVTIANEWILDSSCKRRLIDIANPVQLSVLELVRLIEETLDLVAEVHYVERGSAYEIDTRLTLSYAIKSGVRFDRDYLYNIIKKYFK